LNDAVRCIAFGPEVFQYLQKYRSDAIRIDRFPVDTTTFTALPPSESKKQKFTFFSPTRIGIEKGTDLLWQAIKLCKTDFEVIQVEWFNNDSEEQKKFVKDLLNKKPPQIKFVPIIEHSKLVHYYNNSDAVLGQMLLLFGNIEREAVMCRKPVIHYADPQYTFFIDGAEVVPPFLPKSNDPASIADIIDRVVESPDFRSRLLEMQYQFVKQVCDQNEFARLFERLIFNENRTIIKEKSLLKIKMRFWYFMFAHLFYFSKIKWIFYRCKKYLKISKLSPVDVIRNLFHSTS
jgi:glycosyltransferase involved in cell wall biosynthesis